MAFSMLRKLGDYEYNLKQYRKNLELQIRNNDIIYNAVLQFQSGFSVPERPADTRTLAEKISNIQQLKDNLRANLVKITDSNNANIIIDKLDDDELIRAVQLFPTLSAKLKPLYSLGIPSEIFIQALDNIIKIENTGENELSEKYDNTLYLKPLQHIDNAKQKTNKLSFDLREWINPLWTDTPDEQVEERNDTLKYNPLSLHLELLDEPLYSDNYEGSEEEREEELSKRRSPRGHPEPVMPVITNWEDFMGTSLINQKFWIRGNNLAGKVKLESNRKVCRNWGREGKTLPRIYDTNLKTVVEDFLTGGLT